MGKSILVIDTPKGCYYCPFHQYPVFCGIKGKETLKTMYDNNGVANENSEFPKWCPLQDAPQKKDKNPYHNEHESGYADGWNDCVSKILKGG